MKPAQSGEAQLVPPTEPMEVPFFETKNTPSAGIATSG